MAFGNLPWIRRQSSTTAPASGASFDGDKLRKRRESLSTASYTKKTVTLQSL